MNCCCRKLEPLRPFVISTIVANLRERTIKQKAQLLWSNGAIAAGKIFYAGRLGLTQTREKIRRGANKNLHNLYHLELNVVAR
jgi:hypothetical protein